MNEERMDTSSAETKKGDGAAAKILDFGPAKALDLDIQIARAEQDILTADVDRKTKAEVLGLQGRLKQLQEARANYPATVVPEAKSREVVMIPATIRDRFMRQLEQEAALTNDAEDKRVLRNMQEAVMNGNYFHPVEGLGHPPISIHKNAERITGGAVKVNVRLAEAKQKGEELSEDDRDWLRSKTLETRQEFLEALDRVYINLLDGKEWAIGTIAHLDRMMTVTQPREDASEMLAREYKGFLRSRRDNLFKALLSKTRGR